MTVFDHPARIEAAVRLMGAGGIDCLLVSVGADLPYLTGYEAMPLERLTMLVLTHTGEATLVVPELEAPRVPPGPFQMMSWKEHQDPIALVARLAGRPSVAAIGDTTWSVFLLGLLAKLTATTFIAASSLTGQLRVRKDPREAAALREAAAAVDRVVARIPAEVVFAGRSERQVSRRVAEMTLEEGHDVATFWIVASGPNSASPHHEPGDRVIQPGDPVVIDFGGRRHGYCSDVTRTFVVGDPTPELVEVHQVVVAAQEAGRQSARGGVTAGSVDQASRRVISEAGYGEYFIHRLGHGIGMEGHEHPYLIDGNEQRLEPGMSFSIEPGIYLPGRFGVRIEDIALISADGSLEVLNQADRTLVSVG